ncbi:MAG: ComEC/Rec2 family competence protein [Patescibacteria group bacterium]
MERRFLVFATAAGWLGLAFLGGILLHSFWPYVAVSVLVFVAGSVVGVGLVSSGWVKVMRPATFVGLILLSFLFGLWRFDAVRPSLPRGLKPLSSKGLAYVPASARDRLSLGAWRTSLTTRIQTFFPGDEGALLSGILYGERGLSKEAKDDFRRAGLLHIIAVSGSNVTIVATIVMLGLLGIGLSRRFAFLLFSFVLTVFVLFVQPSASVVRAAIMGWLIELAPVVGRLPRASRLLLVAAVTFSFWKPWALLYDASFALSFLAMWGLLTWGRWIDDRLRNVLPWDLIRGILASTIGATVMTVPYAAWAFGQVSGFALVTGLFVLPLIPWIMGAGTVALFLPCAMTVLPTRGFLLAVLSIARLPDIIGFGYWSNVSLDWMEMLGLYLLIFVIWRFINSRKRLIHRKGDNKSRKLYSLDERPSVLTSRTVLLQALLPFSQEDDRRNVDRT